MLLVGEGGWKRPRRALAENRGATGLQRSKRQRAVGGGIEVTDLARYLEQGALGWEHLDGLFAGDTSIMADLDHASHRCIAPSTSATPCGQGRVAAWRIPPLTFARFLFCCSADTKPYMDCAGRCATNHATARWPQKPGANPNDRRPRDRSHSLRTAKGLDLEQGERRPVRQLPI